jgi:hypothetical protein
MSHPSYTVEDQGMTEPGLQSTFRPSAFMDPSALLTASIERRAGENPAQKIKMGIWLNPNQNLLVMYQQGIDLVEIVEGLPDDEDQNFETVELERQGELPAVRLVRTTPAALKKARSEQNDFAVQLEENLESHAAQVVYPSAVEGSALDSYRKIVG